MIAPLTGIMGPCLSTPKRTRVRRAYTSAHSSIQGESAGYYARVVIPDFGVSSAFEVLKKLGEGGTGTTWLCRERSNGLEHAIKFMQRPIPKAALSMLRHEILVRRGVAGRIVA